MLLLQHFVLNNKRGVAMDLRFLCQLFSLIGKEVFIALPAAGYLSGKVKLVFVGKDYITVERDGKKTFIQIAHIMSISEV